MLKKIQLKKRPGFTLIEIIAVLIILGILIAIAIPKYIDLTHDAQMRALDAAVSELNGRESLTWAREKLAGTYVSDATFYNNVNRNLGSDYTVGAGATSADINFQGAVNKTANRTISDANQPARWAW